MYKIFFKDRIIHLTDQIETSLTDDFGAILKYANQGELKEFIEDFEKDVSIKSAFVYSHNLSELLKNFRSCFHSLPAAGGLVWNTELNRFIGMNRLGFYDLPKGKVEKGETFEEAAIREVEEECGITDLTILKSLTSTFHTYPLKGQTIFKETRWYEMQYHGSTLPIPQAEENIESVFWVDPEKMGSFISATYPSILEVLKKSDHIQLR